MRRLPLVALCLLSPLACKTLPNGSAQKSLEEPLQASGCSGMDAVETGSKMKGAAIYSLTQRCVFNDQIHSVSIQIQRETFDAMIDAGCKDVPIQIDGKEVDYAHVNSLVIDGHAIPDVGIKVRGNTSKCNLKRQFKFKFDETEMYAIKGGKASLVTAKNKGRRFFGLEGLSIRASANDPAMIREKLASEGFAAIAQAAPTSERGANVYRLSPAKLSVSFRPDSTEGHSNRNLTGLTPDYKGLYSLAENLDKTFLQSRFQKDGEELENFTLVQADMAHASFNRKYIAPDAWAVEYVDGKKAKTPEDEKKAIEKVLTLGDFLASNPSEAEIEKLIDIDSVVNYTAAAILNGHWDSLVSNANNDFLYFDGRRWQLIAWDLDNTLGANIDLYRRLMQNDIFAPAREHKALLFVKLFAPERGKYRQLLKDRLDSGLKGAFSADAFGQRVQELQDLMQPTAASWERPQDQAYQIIEDFMKERRSAIAPQL